MTPSSTVEASYGRVHRRLWQALYAFAGDADVASDALSEAFAQALRRGTAIRDIDAWVWRSAFIICGGLLQQKSRLGAELRIVELRTDEAAIEAEPVVEFVSLLRELTDQQRAIVALRYLGGMQPSDIADAIDSTPGSVRVQLHRAHEQLRTQLQENDR